MFLTLSVNMRITAGGFDLRIVAAIRIGSELKGPCQYELIKKGGGGVSARDEVVVLCTKPVVNTRLKFDEVRRGRGGGV